MTPLRPGIGIEQIEARKARIRQPCHDLGCIAVMQADVGERAIVNGGQRLGHAVDERLDTDEAGARMAFGFRHQMFAAAEAAFQPDVIDSVEQRAQIGRRRRLVELERKPRKQCFEQRRLARLERVPLAASKKGARIT
jgi:hypothetical protein